jgi:hypothetical protein
MSKEHWLQRQFEEAASQIRGWSEWKREALRYEVSVGSGSVHRGSVVDSREEGTIVSTAMADNGGTQHFASGTRKR